MERDVRGVGEIVVRAERRSWRAIFVAGRDRTREIRGETLDVEVPHLAAEVLRRRAQLGAEWRLHLVELRHRSTIELRADVPEFRLVADGDVAEVWVGEDHRGSIYGSAPDGWNAYLSVEIDLRESFVHGFYETRDEAAAAVAAGLVNGRRS